MHVDSVACGHAPSSSRAETTLIMARTALTLPARLAVQIAETRDRQFRRGAPGRLERARATMSDGLTREQQKRASNEADPVLRLPVRQPAIA
jgi:hypothetical protein